MTIIAYLCDFKRLTAVFVSDFLQVKHLAQYLRSFFIKTYPRSSISLFLYRPTLIVNIPGVELVYET
jgi:hypothetical protein